MGYQFTVVRKTFHFTFDARTSRGRMPHKTSWFVVARPSKNTGCTGIGECGPLPGLSREPVDDMDDVLTDLVGQLNALPVFDQEAINRLVPPEWSAVRMALETALLDLQGGGQRILFNNGFIKGQAIPINGLIWMGDMDFMLKQVAEKMEQGYQVLKLKVGGRDFESECHLLDYIRRRYYRQQPEIRLDANGAFDPHEALDKLKELSRFTIHSIEQPVPVGHESMEVICARSPIPVALDEELIGAVSDADRLRLLQRLRPAYLILKPSLHGGFAGCARWIALAEQLNIGWWITSALESNIGLNAICQFTAQYPLVRPQGLGTGQLYHNNFVSPLRTAGGVIRYEHHGAWNLSELMD
ncbi:MAG: o-succinylbenzoate synthase [Cyclobacteriaceae bacterium]|nr:MAG: o-succinylbenzoate synthase [Cyclobacteriaceae bacterium]